MSAEEMHTIVQMETPSSSLGIFTLPCGYLDETTQELITEVEVREMCGYEEDLLSSDKVSTVEKISRLIAGCVLRIGDVKAPGRISNMTRKLLLGDRVFLLFAIRRVTLGDEMPLREKCPSCGTTSLFVINLAEDLEIKPMPDPRKRIHDVVLPSGIKVRFRVSSGEDEHRLERVRKRKQMDSISQMMLMRVELINGEPPSLTAMQRMGWKDRRFLRDKFNEVEGGVDTDVEYVCPDCGNEWEKRLDISGKGFFSPGDQPPR